jgi:hypothetical protein
MRQEDAEMNARRHTFGAHFDIDPKGWFIDFPPKTAFAEKLYNGLPALGGHFETVHPRALQNRPLGYYRLELSNNDSRLDEGPCVALRRAAYGSPR